MMANKFPDGSVMESIHVAGTDLINRTRAVNQDAG